MPARLHTHTLTHGQGHRHNQRHAHEIRNETVTRIQIDWPHSGSHTMSPSPSLRQHTSTAGGGCEYVCRCAGVRVQRVGPVSSQRCGTIVPLRYAAVSLPLVYPCACDACCIAIGRLGGWAVGREVEVRQQLQRFISLFRLWSRFAVHRAAAVVVG